VRKEIEMRLSVMIVVIAAAVLIAGGAMAVPPGKTIVWDNPMGKVTFDGKIHADKGLKCGDCHTKIFPMKKGTKITMAEMNAGKNCGTCHNGEKAFKTSDPANCAKCHKK
jgi:c(7)-type cytochrome triheme protein